MTTQVTLPADVVERVRDKQMEAQRAEFDACRALASAYRNLPAIVDDDYPRMRHRYEGAVNEFLRACEKNGRKV